MHNHIYILDCTGVPCPLPVVRCRDYLYENPGLDLLVIVDNLPARENVSRFLESQGFSINILEQGGKWHIHGEREQAEKQAPVPAGQDSGQAHSEHLPEKKILVLFTSDVLGSGDDTLGHKLLLTFLKTLPEMGADLWRVILLNGAVRLAANGHEAVGPLQALTGIGVSVLVCGTCLEHYDLLESKQVGQTTNMLDVVTSLQVASSVIRP